MMFLLLLGGAWFSSASALTLILCLLIGRTVSTSVSIISGEGLYFPCPPPLSLGMLQQLKMPLLFRISTAPESIIFFLYLMPREDFALKSRGRFVLWHLLTLELKPLKPRWGSLWSVQHCNLTFKVYQSIAKWSCLLFLVIVGACAE